MPIKKIAVTRERVLWAKGEGSVCAVFILFHVLVCAQNWAAKLINIRHDV